MLFFLYRFGYTSREFRASPGMPPSRRAQAMSTAPQSHPWPPEVADDPPVQPPADENYVSEFLSEKSPEFDEVRRAAAEARQRPTLAPSTPAEPDSKMSPAPGRITTARLVPLAWLVSYAGVAVVVLAVAWFFQGRQVAGPGAAAALAAGEGAATIVSRPEGAEVFINGERRGVTPLRLSLPVGSYALELRNGSATRALTLSVDAGVAVREVVDLAPVASTGRLEVTSDVAGTGVAIDGVARGVTPLVLDDIAPGEHRVALTRGATTVNRTVTVQAGATATVFASVAPSGTSGGWLTFNTPVELQVIENGQVLGTTSASRLMVPAGRRQLRLVAAPYGFETTTTVDVGVGRTVAVPVAVPNGRLSINAVPWADVWLNGQPLGATPLANLTVPIGDHAVIWRHPALGERRQSVRVTADTPARVGVDLNR